MAKNGLWLGMRGQPFDQPWKGPEGMSEERRDRSLNNTCSLGGQRARESRENEECQSRDASEQGMMMHHCCSLNYTCVPRFGYASDRYQMLAKFFFPIMYAQLS